MKGLLLMTDNSYNKFRYRILNDNTFFLKERNIAKTIMAVHRFGIRLAYLANFHSSGETVLIGDFNAHKTRDKDYIGDYSFMPDIFPASYVFDSVVKNRNAVKSSVKTNEHGQSLLDLCIASQSRILNGRTLVTPLVNVHHFNTMEQVQ